MRSRPLAFLPTAIVASVMQAHAAITVDGEPVTASNEGTVVIRESDCRVLTRHYPDPDVAYTPGVDVNGRSVAPADLHPPLDLSERARTFGFAVTVDLDDRLVHDGDGLARPFGGEGFLGYVEIRDGVAFWNGKPLDTDGIEAVSAACREVLRKNEKDR